MNYETIVVTSANHVTHVTMNRPEVLNSINQAMHDELQHAFDNFSNDDDQYVCVVNGAGERAFCAGSDLKSISKRGKPHVYPKDGYAGLIERFDLAKPLIAAVDGVAQRSTLSRGKLLDHRLFGRGCSGAPPSSRGSPPAAGNCETQFDSRSKRILRWTMPPTTRRSGCSTQRVGIFTGSTILRANRRGSWRILPDSRTTNRSSRPRKSTGTQKGRRAVALR